MTARLRSLLTVGLLAASALGNVSLAMAEEARVTVLSDKEGVVVNPAVTRGFNFGNWMDIAGQREALSKVPAASLRFPGGNIGDDQDMDAPTLDTLKSLLALVNGKPELVIQTRVFAGRVDRTPSNSPEDAANAVRMAKARKLNVAYWEIGNEPDLFSVVRGDKSWTPERYCEVFRAQAAAIRAVDPQMPIAGPAVSAASASAMAFLERFVELCGDQVDVLTWHMYPTNGDGTEESALATISQVDNAIAHVRKVWGDKASNPLGYQRSVKLAVTEFGLSWKTDRPRFLADQTAALWAAEASLRMAQQGLHAAHYFAFQGTGFHGLLDNGGVPRPSYYAFRMLGQLQGRFVSANSDNAALWSHAVKDANRLQLTLLNTSSEPMQVDLQAPGWKFKQASYFDAHIVEEEQPLVNLPAVAQRITLPARSMASVVFTKNQP